VRPVYVLSAARTPIGKFGGAFAELTAAELGAAAARAAIERSGLPASAVDEAIFGHGRQAGGGPNTARQASHRAGVPDSVPAFTVNKACASSLKAITLGALTIAAGENEIVLAGGHECMSATPYLLPRARFGMRMGNAEVVDGMYRDGFLCPLCGQLMGETAENLVREYGIPRAEQDALAVESQRRAGEAIGAGRFADEITPVTVKGRKGDVVVAADEHPRPETTLASIAKLPPVFEENGTVHAGNSSGITDGAAAVVVASERAVEEHGLTPLARVVGYAQAEVAPKWLFLAPIEGVRALERRTELAPDDYDLVEVNEAFAAQTLADGRELGFDWDKVNVNGGAIALGHPIGASGARIVATLVHELGRRGGRYGLATLCLGGGGSVAMAVERV